MCIRDRFRQDHIYLEEITIFKNDVTWKSMGYFVIQTTASRIRIIHETAFYTNLKWQDIGFFTATTDIFFYFPKVKPWLCLLYTSARH